MATVAAAQRCSVRVRVTPDGRGRAPKVTAAREMGELTDARNPGSDTHSYA